MDHSEHKTDDTKDTTLWGGAPQYDYVHYENCTSYGIPTEAGHEIGGTGDDVHFQEKALNHIQVGWARGVGSTFVYPEGFMGFPTPIYSSLGQQKCT